MGKGAGDLNIKAECRLLIQRYDVYDRTFYDESSSANLSKYSIVSNYASITYDVNNKSYLLKNQKSNSFNGGTLKDLQFSSNVEISADINMVSTTNNAQFAFLFGNLFARVINANNSSVKQITLSGSDFNNIAQENISNLSFGVWYNLKLTIKNNIATLTLKQDSTTLASITGDVSQLISSSNQFTYMMGYSINMMTYIKNIQIQGTIIP